MEGAALMTEDVLDPPPRLYERLHQIAGYTWDESKLPFRSTYDFWHVFGTRCVSPISPSTSQSHNISSPGSVSRLSSGNPSPAEHPGHHFDESHFAAQYTPPAQQVSPSQPNFPHITSFFSPTLPSESSYVEEPVVARISYHGLREERAFHIAKSLTATVDPTGEHIAKPIDLFRLNTAPGDRAAVIVAIYHNLGDNYLPAVLDLGPAYYKAKKEGESYKAFHDPFFKLHQPISLQLFLDFAIGASKCLEILHHGQGIIHGEIRGDAFHFNKEENKVRIASFGSGTRSFENGLTSTGWSSLSKELGAKTKLLYISPEQTGRMPAEPDSRTDIYSLGVLFWMLLTQQQVFDGDTALDIVQGVLGRRIPNVSDIRIDIPDVVGRIIQKCTAKNVTDRYHSASGLRHDLEMVQNYLADGNWAALKELKIASKDVSSFFMLPTIMIGRQRERNQLIKAIDRVSKSHPLDRKGPSSRFSDGSMLSNDVGNMDDLSSEGASSADGTTRRSGSFTHTASSDPAKQRISFQQSFLSDSQTLSTDNGSSSQSSAQPRTARLWERQQSISVETRSLVDSVGTEGTRTGIVDSPVSSLSRQLGSAKFRRRGHCEVVTVEGVGGLGKSCLVQSVLVDARRLGYCATAKFDTTRRKAFGPLLKLLSALFKQVWGERNTETPFHQGLKQYLRPVWPMLHRVLGLPEFLFGPPDSSPSRPLSSTGSLSRGPSWARRRGSSPGCSPAPLAVNPSIASQSSQDFLRAGASTKTIRLMQTFLDVLRVFTAHKLVCFCLEDLHYADDESLELISQIIGAGMKMVVIVTYRPDELSPERVQRILHPPESEEFPRSGGPVVTRIPLSPLNEEDIVEYVSKTLRRPPDQVLPLALVIQSKTAGNPFYIREMLSACFRKKCIWYDYRDSVWHFDLDRLFEQFRAEKDYDVLDTAFVTQRLAELPSTARALLAWAALLGNSFSFELICRLMGGEFEHHAQNLARCCGNSHCRGYSQHDAIAGLQAAIQAYIIVPSEEDDRFRFAHDRYITAAGQLEECSARRMHFIIAQTLLKYYSTERRWRDNTAFHVCEAVDIIQQEVSDRAKFRELLITCAQSSIENGARPTAAKYYSAAVKLLQTDAWALGASDVSYQETLQLHLRLAECYVFMGQHSLAQELLGHIFVNAETAIDKAPAFVLQSRIFAQTGNTQASVVALKECLGALGVTLDDSPTYEKCDERFERFRNQFETMDRTTLTHASRVTDPSLESVGAVLSETVAAAWWTDCLRFYHLSLVMLEAHLSRGAFPQSGMAFLYVGVVAIARFNLTGFAAELGSIAAELLSRANDAFSMSRGLMLSPILIGHTCTPMPLLVAQVEDAVELASSAGDRMSTILSYGLLALIRLFSVRNLADLEAFCKYGCEEIPDWYFDARGGVLLLAVSQVSRSLQGKTRIKDPIDVISDEHHNTVAYKNWLAGRNQHSNRSILLYESLELVPLFIYGHYDRAVEIGRRCFENLELFWSLRNSRLVVLVYGLALTGRLLRRMHDPRSSPNDHRAEVEQVVQDLQKFSKMIKDWAGNYNVNYYAWWKILDAQIAELKHEHGVSIQHYEETLDHAAEHDFVFEEALANFLMAGFFLRRKARRSARSALLEAVGLYRQLGASGVATAIEEEHSLLLHGPTRNYRTMDVGVQTDFVADSGPDSYRQGDAQMDEALSQVTPHQMTQLKGERIGAWRGSMNVEPEAGAGLPALDMIDLHAILKSSQVISSMLQIEELLKTMCDVILQTCGSSATLVSIVVQENDSEDWCVAASGNPEGGASAHRPGLPLSETSLVAEDVVLYCTRFFESVFIRDPNSDERFGNVSNSWTHRNPQGKAIIAIPITHGNKPLLGVLYLEGEPGSFTDRNVTVLELLVNQIGISYANAIAMKNVEKISAENRSMISIQKRALDKAIEAETKAKNAEAEAKRNVKLAEEAAKAKSIFLANVSHELRTPLNGVIGNSELLRDSDLNKDQLEMADSIRVSADLLLTVINDILDFSKMEADKMKLYVIAFNPEEMVREVVRAVSYSNREKTSKKNVRIIQDINLPPMLIYGDPIRLHQVLGNLIGNSLKFTEDGSITIGARLDSETKEKATLTFWVRDTGIGIPPRQLAKLFQPFSQADASTARKYGGSGLGLSICKSLIETMMKGKIQLESEETVGTTAWFTVSFDKAKSDVAAGDVQSKSTPHIERTVSFPSSEQLSPPEPYFSLSNISKEELRICVAEDNPINQKIAIQYVQRLGYHNVSAYENGMKAVEGLRKKAKEGDPYHIVLMDVHMPVLDGYEATKLIRKDSNEAVRNVLIIAMTASAIQGDREKCIAAGMNDYLAKPVRSEVLKKKLNAYLSSKQSPTSDLVVDPPRAPTRKVSTPSSNAQTSSSSSSSATPALTVSDPMRDGAVFNQPVDSTALESRESPVLTSTVPLDTGPNAAHPQNNGVSATDLADRTRTSSESLPSPPHMNLSPNSQPPLPQPSKLIKPHDSNGLPDGVEIGPKSNSSVAEPNQPHTRAPDSASEQPKHLIARKPLNNPLPPPN
ncbi:unnamed protein product [Clonostachys rhizophaga]|uniref:histidine kinase n=1 Tax=Clonostachys rhizophaga TaxID=160324 RepID=A0A9N9UX99_9HYPO|nr:unnamed protein product [Clonostachys rhizophaga]